MKLPQLRITNLDKSGCLNFKKIVPLLGERNRRGWAKKRRLVDLGEDWGARGLEDKSESEKLTAASWPREGGDPARF